MKIDPGMPRASLGGVVLFCGPYDPASLNFDGPFADFMRTVIWSYVGTRNPHDARVRQMSIAPHVTAVYPPAFISVGNADPSRRNRWHSPKRCAPRVSKPILSFSPTIMIRRWITNINCCFRLTQAASRLTVQSYSWRPTQSDSICACADPAELLLPRPKMRAGARRSDLLVAAALPALVGAAVAAVNRGSHHAAVFSWADSDSARADANCSRSRL